MAHLPENQAQFEYTKMQLVGSLGAVAETMRNCATFAEQFATLVASIHYPGAPLMYTPNGQMPPPPPPMEQTGGKRKSRGGEDGEGKKKRKTKPKDPNAPKRPPSSYLLFQNEVRQELKAKNPNIPNNELLAKIAKAWNDMPKEQKDRYEERQRTAKDSYMERKKQYERSLVGAAAGSAPAGQAVINPAEIAAAAVAPSPVAASSEPEDNDDDNEDADEDANDESSSSGSSDDEAAPPSKKSKQEAEPKAEKEKKRKSKA